jgi:phospholipase/carboxylesterase
MIQKIISTNQKEGLDIMIYIKGFTLHKCLINLPENYTLEESCTLVVGLHGGGSNPNKLITLWDQIPNRGFIYSVPQAPYPLVEDTELMFDWALWPSGNAELIGKATQLSETYIANVVQDISDRYNIDEVYLMGFSQGAIFAYLVGIKQHHLFNGIISLSGPGLLAPMRNPFASSFGPDWLAKEYIQGAEDLRVFITHGKDDQAAKYDLGIRSRDILINHGYDVAFRDFEGGHIYPPKTIVREIADWIKGPNQKK